MFGSVVICLPTPFTGVCLSILPSMHSVLILPVTLLFRCWERKQLQRL
jgi:hypothetical protein